MNLTEAVEIAARDLPEGWEIVIRVEQGSGCIALFDEDECAHEFRHDPTDSLASQVLSAVEYANILLA